MIGVPSGTLRLGSSALQAINCCGLSPCSDVLPPVSRTDNLSFAVGLTSHCNGGLGTVVE
jgi:hypothetical protein